MTKEQWLQQATKNKQLLKSFLGEWHPVVRNDDRTEFQITAPRVEAVVDSIRKSIRQEKHGHDPLAEFEAALSTGNIVKIMSLLDEAWFGVPESTSCWDIPGFSEAVELLDDPPEERT